MLRKVEWEITPGACVSIAVALLLLPLRWLLAAITAAIAHECGHYGAIRLCGGNVYRIQIKVGKTIMETEPMHGIQGVLCALAGPLGSFSTLLLGKYFSALAICGLIQGIYNLIPIYPLDGGRVLHCCFEALFPQSGYQAAVVVERTLTAVLFCICLYGTIQLKAGFLLLFMFPILVSKLLSVKNTLQRIERASTIEEDQNVEV